MVLKVVKPKPKRFKISYAMLSNYVKQEEPKTIKTEPKVQKQEQKSSFASEYEKIVDEAIRKNLVDEDEREMKIIELESLSKDEFDKYVKSVKDEDFLDIQNLANDNDDDENLTEAERALKMIRGGGGGGLMADLSTINNSSDDDIMDGFSASTHSGSRSLSSIKHSEFDVEDYNAFNEDKFVVDLLSGMKKTGALNNQEVVVQKPVEQKKELNSMSNLKGLTKPIVISDTQQTSSTNSLQDALNNIDWSMGAR